LIIRRIKTKQLIEYLAKANCNKKIIFQLRKHNNLKMKEILIMRHAKSDWSTMDLKDFDRPLNKRGRKAAVRMAQELANRNMLPDTIIASPAARAKETTELMLTNKAFQLDVEWEKEFYMARNSVIINKLHNLPETVKRPLLVGHNPTWEDVVALLAKNTDWVTMPTATIVLLKFDGKWTDLKPKSAKLEWLIKPKMFM